MIAHFKEMLNQFTVAMESIDEKTFDKLVNMCIDTLNTGHKIVVTGLGKNVPVCDKFVGSMLSLGLRANFMHTNTAIHGDIGMVEDGDLVIILSKSGETVESIYLTELLKQRKATLWLVSFAEHSTLTEKIENCLIMRLDHEGDMWNIMPNNSTAVNMMLLQGLVQEIARKMEIPLSQFKRNHPGGHIGVQLKNV